MKVLASLGHNRSVQRDLLGVNVTYFLEMDDAFQAKKSYNIFLDLDGEILHGSAGVFSHGCG